MSIASTIRSIIYSLALISIGVITIMRLLEVDPDSQQTSQTEEEIEETTLQYTSRVIWDWMFGISIFMTWVSVAALVARFIPPLKALIMPLELLGLIPSFIEQICYIVIFGIVIWQVAEVRIDLDQGDDDSTMTWIIGIGLLLAGLAPCLGMLI